VIVSGQRSGSKTPGSRPIWRTLNSLAGAAMFVAPLLALVAIWAIVVPLFDVNPRIFPSLASVADAAADTIRDGSLIRHIGASLLRVGLGTLIGVVTARSSEW
jgi:taurine transport system permease protein